MEILDRIDHRLPEAGLIDVVTWPSLAAIEHATSSAPTRHRPHERLSAGVADPQRARTIATSWSTAAGCRPDVHGVDRSPAAGAPPSRPSCRAAAQRRRAGALAGHERQRLGRPGHLVSLGCTTRTALRHLAEHVDGTHALRSPNATALVSARA